MPAPSATSLLDRVDDMDEPIGVVARRDVFRLRASFRTVHVFVRNNAGQLLLQQVGAERERSPLRWGSSVAGYLFAGESYAEAARRRLAEELGLQTPLAKLGGTRMADNGATKFIELFTTEADSVEHVELGHIQAVQFVDLPTVDARLASHPEQFTETFPHVYRLYRTIVEA